MNKFNVGDYVYFNDCQMAGEIEQINQDGTYEISWNEGRYSGRMDVLEEDMELGKRPDFRVIPEMNEQEFDEAINKVLEQMRKQYPIMHMGDLQTVAMFSKMFKDEYLKDYRQ